MLTKGKNPPKNAKRLSLGRQCQVHQPDRSRLTHHPISANHLHCSNLSFDHSNPDQTVFLWLIQSQWLRKIMFCDRHITQCNFNIIRCEDCIQSIFTKYPLCNIHSWSIQRLLFRNLSNPFLEFRFINSHRNVKQ